jgi:hypothetical protein
VTVGVDAGDGGIKPGAGVVEGGGVRDEPEMAGVTALAGEDTEHRGGIGARDDDGGLETGEVPALGGRGDGEVGSGLGDGEVGGEVDVGMTRGAWISSLRTRTP